MKDAEARVAEAEGLVREAAAEKERERQALLDGQKGEEEERVRAAQRQAQEEEALRKKAEEKVCVCGGGYRCCWCRQWWCWRCSVVGLAM